MSAEELQDSLEVFIEQRGQLPDRCPSWCDGLTDHIQGLEEGNDLASSSRHHGPEHGVVAWPMPYRLGKGWHREATGSINLRLLQDHRQGRDEVPLVDLTAHTHRAGTSESAQVTVALTSAEIRVLARQMLHLADLVDLD